MRAIKTLAVTALLLSALLLGNRAVYANFANDACLTLKESDPSVQCDAAGGDPSKSITSNKQVNTLAENVVNVMSILVGTVSVVMIIIGGFRYVTSGGDANNTKGAKDTILYAVVGLVIVLFAQVIVRFVLTQTTKSASPAKKTTAIVAPLS